MLFLNLIQTDGGYRTFIGRSNFGRYSHLFFVDEYCEQFASLCVQLLNLLLDFDPTTYTLDTIPSSGASESPSGKHLQKTLSSLEPSLVPASDSVSNATTSNASSAESSPELGVGDLFKTPIVDKIDKTDVKIDLSSENDTDNTLPIPTRSLLLEDVPLGIADSNCPPLSEIIFGPGATVDLKVNFISL